MLRLWTLIAIGMLVGKAMADPPSVSGDAVIRRKAGDSEIVITTTTRLAGAIHSLTWNGREFIDSHDHGRQLQSACSFNCAKPGEFWAECFNPTEAGSRHDAIGNHSTSRLLELHAEGAELRAKTLMAFWLAPGERSSGRLALNDQKLSQHVIAKHVHIGHGELAHVIDYDVTFTVPEGEQHSFAQFEALTGYMPAEFRRFWTFDLATDKLKPLDDGPGEQRHPVVFTTDDGHYAMGIYSPDQPSLGFERAGYGRFRFAAEKVVKWNCVFRVANLDGVPSGDYRFRMFVAVGTLDDVRTALTKLTSEKN
jgi:hypothetical protein